MNYESGRRYSEYISMIDETSKNQEEFFYHLDQTQGKQLLRKDLKHYQYLKQAQKKNLLLGNLIGVVFSLALLYKLDLRPYSYNKIFPFLLSILFLPTYYLKLNSPSSSQRLISEYLYAKYALPKT